MTLGEKLSKLRKENNYTQEQLAEVLGVSRQSISKWESNLTYPETDKLIRMSDLFDCSLDYLLKDTVEMNGYDCNGQKEVDVVRHLRLRERKSEKMVCGMPMWHIGRNARGFIAVGLNARGIIAVGLKARGIVSLGVLPIGLLSFGVLSLGLISIGTFALGILSIGSIAMGLFAAGAIGLGLISMGAIAVGDFSVGALALGKYFALGDNARAMIAIGDTQAAGSVFQKIGELTVQEVVTVKQLLDDIVPTHLSWAKDIIKLFI